MTDRFCRYADIDGYQELEELALDLIWYWDKRAVQIWEQLDSELYALLRNPWALIQTVSKERLKEVLSDPRFRQILHELTEEDRKLHDGDGGVWFHQKSPPPPLTAAAYFSMEFMLSEALPIYSGGLGNVAGDQLKAASDLGVPVIGIGLLYQRGYFRQIIDREGRQQAINPYNEPGQLPITPLRLKNGELLRIQVNLPGFALWLRAWEVEVGRTKIYLLDSNDAANYPPHRGITSELYGGDSEMRLKQEIVLGIGGWRLLQKLEISPEVCHLNEGHAAFATIERARSFMIEQNLSFEAALAATRAGNLFTTHTAVPAGFDSFSPDLIRQYFTAYAEGLGIGIERFLSLGRSSENDPEEPFHTAYLGVRGSCCVNGVSQLHGKVSRAIFNPLFPRRPSYEVPIGYVTNGIHTPSWQSPEAETLWESLCGKNPWQQDPKGVETAFRQVSDEEIWKMRNQARKSMIEYGRKTLGYLWQARGYSEEEIAFTKKMFDERTLTLGFARRFATYKRSNILLHDKERLLRILTNSERPVQLVLSGKAHPADLPAQEMIQEWMQFIRSPEVRPHVIFLSDYNMLIAERLVRGVDVWINTPRRPWEACGTSGMKLLANGGLNLSELDGWWVEAYSPDLGWALGDGKEHGDDPVWDRVEAELLYDLLEQQVIPEFYDRGADGIPRAWVSRIRESMATLTPRFSANRCVREYVDQHYIPAAKKFMERTAEKGAIGKKIADWQKRLADGWSTLSFGEVKFNTRGEVHEFEVEVDLGALSADDLRVELFAVGISPIIMSQADRRGRWTLYRGEVSESRPVSDYCPRIVPYLEEASIPLEATEILWQR